eukprot:TRINITY_DN2000_c0_g1_i1.p1 TRINITY_DN2000_c0_g1~~TRINITY_DN2000_c0_g1_i1.p1  ORF type:complete len:542 (-),score=133.70 TRINITY_DN2000_c0_g1_i1:34-1659(-)
MAAPVPPEPVIPVRAIKIGRFTGAEKVIRNIRSNHHIVMHDCADSAVVVSMNQRLRGLTVVNCVRCAVQVLDSCVIGTEAVEFVNCTDCEVFFDETYLKTLRAINVVNCRFKFGDSPALLDNWDFIWNADCHGNSIETTEVKPGTNPNTVIRIPTVTHCAFAIPDSPDHVLVTRMTPDASGVINKPYAPASVSFPMRDPARTADDVTRELEQAESNNNIVNEISTEVLGRLYDEELREYLEPEEQISAKAKQVAEYIRSASHCVVYTGAGVSTSASIPDYRGPEGMWTRHARGEIFGESPVLEDALPTYTHYAIAELVRTGKVKYIVSTNLDGLHRRSGVPREAISELHGNCYCEVCVKCKREYLRHFNTLHTRTDRWTHLTGRKCECGGDLRDTICHFTENVFEEVMTPAVQQSRASDLSIVLGTSMNVQPAAALCEKALANPNGKLVIVNIQHTPYDKTCTCRVFARTDDFMRQLMLHIGTPEFDTKFDLLQNMREVVGRQLHSRTAAERGGRVHWRAVATPVVLALLALVVFALWQCA